MTDSPQTPIIELDPMALSQATDLLTHYGFDLGNQSLETRLQIWAAHYPTSWIRQAVIEALYQGRYKAISVDQILQFWHRRQQPQPLFNSEFERLVCERFPQNLFGKDTPSTITALAKQLQAKPAPLDPADGQRQLSQLADAEPTAGPTDQVIAAPSVQTAAIPAPDFPWMKPEFDPTDSPLEALTASVQRRIPLQQSVDTLIDQASASLQTSADQGKRQVRPESEQLREPPLAGSSEVFIERSPAVSQLVSQSASLPILAIPLTALPMSAISGQASPVTGLSGTVEPAIQQFQPNSSQFYVKLKAVQEPDDADSAG